MPANPSASSSWRWCAISAAVLVLLSLIPQIHLWLARGSQWHGAYATIQGDEFLYSAYINALIENRPRRNDPFAGRDDTPQSPMPESTFSIQFIPSFVIASLARISGISASTAFIILIGAAGLLASLAVFWLLASIIGDQRLATVGIFVVLCFGALAAGQGLIGLLLKPDVMFLGLPFLRRYQPSAMFPLFFVFCSLLWRALTSQTRRKSVLNSMLAGITQAILVFSYIYIWTAAAAWFLCLAALWLFLRPRNDRWRGAPQFLITGGITMLALVPYAYVLSHRAKSLDAAQTLTFTHRLDLLRVPELIGFLILTTLFIGLRRQQIHRNEPSIVFAVSFALLPLLLFNQQIITGRSMQPYHFENFVANYAVLVSLVIVAARLLRDFTNRRLFWIAALCLFWGLIETSLPVFANFRSNIEADRMVPVLLRLKELSNQDGTLVSLHDQGRTSTLVFSPQREVMGILPTWTSQGSLLGMGSLDFSSATPAERKESLYLYLYYAGADAERFRDLLNNRAGDFYMSHYARIASFGHERVVPMLSSGFIPIRQEEIEDEVKLYDSYVDSISRERVLQHVVTYVVTDAKTQTDFSRIDRWYERDEGEQIGDYNLYRVKLRN